ncbi:MAG TPA: hypothetical protein VIL22_00615, partial [Paenibacillaceae bacterium]
ALQGWAIPSNGKGVAWLQFAGDTPHEDLERMTERFARLVVEALKKYLDFDATVGIGRFYPHVADIPVSCQEAERALQYRLFRETENVLFIDRLEQEKSGSASVIRGNWRRRSSSRSNGGTPRRPGSGCGIFPTTFESRSRWPSSIKVIICFFLPFFSLWKKREFPSGIWRSTTCSDS